ncbi:MAG TPA: PfkB family carbohydrate kinase [Acidimicrobiia bacterium]
MVHMGHSEHTVTVFAPTLYLTVTVEASGERDEIHVHPGGQGFWIARMLKHLGERPLLCGPLGGESGQVFMGLLAQWGMDLSPIKVSAPTSIIISDRRSGDREVWAESPMQALERHELDDAYGRLLDHALGSSVCVVTGQPNPIVPADTYRRLGHDLATGDVMVVADLHGPELDEFFTGGPIDILKVSDEDLAADGLLPDADADQQTCMAAIDALMERGARAVVLSRQDRPALASFGGRLYEAQAPELDPADHRGAGDSMTAGLTAGRLRGHEPVGILELACAAGAANVTRHGLGSADEDLIASLSERVAVRELSPTRR